MNLLAPIERAAYAAKRVLWRARRRRYRAGQSLSGPRVLVRMDAGIGNAVEATPLVQAVRMLWPRAKLSILPPPGDLFDDWNIVDEVVTAEGLRGRRFDHTFLAWSVERATRDFDPGTVHRAEGLFPLWQLRPEREIDLRPARALGWRGATPPLYVSMKPPPRPPPERFPESSCRIAIAPGGKPDHRWRNKRWPHFEELVTMLLDRHADAQILLIGTAADAVGALPDTPRVVDTRGRTLRETAWLLKRCRLAIGNDCGPMHIADAVMTPSLVLFGPTCDVKNGPLYRGVTVTSDIACSPCQYDLALLDGCPHGACLKDLPAARVAELADRILGSRGGEHAPRAAQVVAS
jgi:ADP-heptose:LPS heptosyltransferase